MAYIEIYPKNLRAQVTLTDKQDLLFDSLTNCVKKAFGVPDTDIIAELHECSVISFCSKAVTLGVVPDVVIKIHTNDIEFQEKAEKLKELILDDWNCLFGEGIALECWINFFHTWGCNVDVN